jgi:uncharacterized protein (DUF58 family)
VNGPAPGGRWSGGRTLNAALTGLVAGVSAVVVTRALFGPGVVLAGAVVGVVAMAAGVLMSWGGLTSGHRREALQAGGHRLRTRTHPVAWFAPVAGSAVAMLAWAGVAHSSGSGWVQAVGALLAAVLIVGLAAPYLQARRGTLTCHACPSDVEAGRTVTLTMEASGPMRIRPCHPVGPVTTAQGPARGARTVEVVVTPMRRGVVETLAVELASCAPFGLLWWAREVLVPLPRPMHVAPRLGESGPMVAAPDSSAGDAPRRIPAGIGEPRGVRPYRTGDTRRSVHWPATSHVGTVMVREKERPTDDPVVVEVVLPPEPAAAETESERVMGGVTHCLVRGETVVLGTHEAQGHVVRAVRDRIDLGRRLARAVPMPGPAPADRSNSPRGGRRRRGG